MTFTMEELLKKAPLQSIRDYAEQYAVIGNVEFTHSDGTVMTRQEWHRAMNREEALLDRYTLQIASHDRSQLAPRESLPEWQIKAERASFQRQQLAKGRQNEMV